MIDFLKSQFSFITSTVYKSSDLVIINQFIAKSLKITLKSNFHYLLAEWWSTYGGACPNLSRLALRILNQTCSANGCDRTQILFEQVHTQRMNSLEHQRLTDLIFVQYNLRLQQK